MDRKTAEEFWTTYFGLIMHEGADTCMGNPFKEFIKEAPDQLLRNQSEVCIRSFVSNFCYMNFQMPCW